MLDGSFYPIRPTKIALDSSMRAGVALTFSFGFLAFAACGDQAAPPPDAGAPPKLEIVAPGDQIGLAPGDAQMLTVKLVDGGGVPIGGAPVSWKLTGPQGGTGGSTLSAATSATAGDGTATNTLTAGPARVDFEVTASSGTAAQATFFISVSANGFTTIDVTTVHQGARHDVDHVELRAYRGAMDCASLDPDALPASTLAPRQATAFGMTTEWAQLPAGDAYTIVAWGAHAVSMRAISFGCAQVLASQVAPGQLAMQLAVADRPLAIGTWTVSTTLDLAPAAQAETAAGLDRPWRVLACPVGAGQLALDWLVDAIANDGALDGVTVNPTGAALAIENARGALGTDGCRAADKGTQPSLDAKVEAAIAAGTFPSGATRVNLITARTDMLGTAGLTSTIAPAGAATFTHTLEMLTAPNYSIDLLASARPVVAATAAWSYDGKALVLGAHAFTARLGSALGDGFAQTAVAGAGLPAPGAGDTLGTTLFGSAKEGSLTGCPAIDAIVCPAASLAAGCTSAACAPAAAGLDGGLTAWWRALDGTALDLSLSGTANTGDADGDLVLDPVSGGLWSATLTPAALAPIATTGTWTSTSATPRPPPAGP
jgi:hypothetical protein